MADPIELFISQTVGAVVVFFVGRAILGAVRSRLSPTRPATQVSPSQHPWAEEDLSAEQVWQFLSTQDGRLQRSLEALPEPQRGECLLLAKSTLKLVRDVDRWLDEVRTWPEHQRHSLENQAQIKIAARTQALLDLARAVSAAGAPREQVDGAIDGR
jgi:hypothetical protein